MKVRNNTVCRFHWCSDSKMMRLMEELGIVKPSIFPSLDWELRQSYIESPDGRGQVLVPAIFKFWIRWMYYGCVFVFEKEEKVV